MARGRKLLGTGASRTRELEREERVRLGVFLMSSGLSPALIFDSNWRNILYQVGPELSRSTLREVHLMTRVEIISARSFLSFQ